MKKAYIEQQLQSHKWLNQLIEDQIKLNKTTDQNFGDEYKGNKLKSKFRNVTTRKKRKSFCTANYFPLSAHDALPLTSENRLRDVAGIYTKIPIDRAKKMALAKDVFSDIIKQIPPENYKKFKIDYDQSDNINIEEVRTNHHQVMTTYDIKTNRIQNLFRNLQKNLKSIFYAIENLSRTILNKTRKSAYDKDKVFVNLYDQLEDPIKIIICLSLRRLLIKETT